MKTLKLILLATIVIIGLSSAKAQTDTNIYFMYQGEILSEMQKFNMPIFSFPAQDPCDRGGQNSAFGKKWGIDSVMTFDPHWEWGIGDSLVTFEQEDTTERIVYWIHGLNGTTDSWEVAAKKSEQGVPAQNFPARKLKSVRGIGYNGPPHSSAYSENGSIYDASDDWENIALSLNNQLTPYTNKDFIIGHSQGGIVGREWLRNMEENPSTFHNFAHGLVTFGTPHAGAMILNNTSPNMGNKLPQFFNEGCVKLADAYVMPKIWANFLTSMFLGNTIRNAIGASCFVFSNSIIPYALANNYSPTTLDYYVGSPFLTQGNQYHPTGLSNYTLKVPVIQFYGEETQPVMWKYFSSVFGIGQDQLNNDEKIFGYDVDTYLEKKVNKMITELDADYYKWKAMYDYWSNYDCQKNPGIQFNYNCLYCTSRKSGYMYNSKEAMDVYGGASKWLSEANDYYLSEIVGAKVCTQVPHTITFWGRVVTVYVNECKYKPSDGVVLAESASAPILVQSGKSHAYRKMIDTNHEQMKNSQKTKAALLELYDGVYVNGFNTIGEFFKTATR